MSLSRSLKFVFLGCALFAGGCDRQSDAPAQPQAEAGGKAQSGALDRSHKGEALPDMTLTDAQGGEVALSALKGKPVLINLWATWCAPCITELPTLEALAGKSKGRLQVMTIAQDSSPPKKIAGFLKERGFTLLPTVIDAESSLSFHYGTGTLPTTILYDAQGLELWRYVGERNWSAPDSAQLLAEADSN